MKERCRNCKQVRIVCQHGECEECHRGSPGGCFAKVQTIHEDKELAGWRALQEIVDSIDKL